jgi:superfamily II DNA or RNA helicase
LSRLDHIPPYGEADLKQWFYAADLTRSDGYLCAVRILEISGGAITATVRGSQREPYAVSIHFERDRQGRIHLDSTCTCPVGWPCKHVAATLRVARGQAPVSDTTHLAAPRINPDVQRWLRDLRAAASPQTPAKRAAKATQDALYYMLRLDEFDNTVQVVFAKGRRNARGEPSGLNDWNAVERALLQPPAFVNEDDLAILRLLRGTGRQRYDDEYPLRGEPGEQALGRMLATGRLVAARPPHEPFRDGAPRSGDLAWSRLPHGAILPTLVVSGGTADILALRDLWYVDPEALRIGRLEMPCAAPLVRHLLSIPPLTDTDLAAVADALREIAPELPTPAVAEPNVVDCEPVPVLRLDTLPVYGIGRFRDYPANSHSFDYAQLDFDYGAIRLGADAQYDYVMDEAAQVTRVLRKTAQENRFRDDLARLGLTRVGAHHLYHAAAIPEGSLYGLASEAQWPAFMAGAVPELKKAGWRIDIAPGFRHHILEVEAWDAEITETDNGWFNLDMGILVEGQRLALAPLLHALFQRDARWLDAGKLKRLANDTPIDLPTPDGARIRVPAERLKPIAKTLIDLFDGPVRPTLSIAKLDAPRLAALTEEKRWRFRGAEAVRALAQRLKDLAGVTPIEPPRGLALELRPYQREGLAWLQYLRAHDLAGILADDMGLGKTAQTLAHLMLEKETSRLDRPALVVLPTSLVFNWKRESERFAPDLRVLSLHGKDRAERFDSIDAHDVCLTTYPLLWRDAEALGRRDWSLLILDEAQTVKNAASQAAQVVRGLKARHRLCLTGTPLENHLGELWAQFDFLLPGFLADAKSFAKTWRTPIEKHGDKLRRDLLAARVKPFILRRRKEDVAKELPAKTLIVRAVELEGGQRDLYETVRSAMDIRVREEIASKGFNRSQIVILDALLKLRQVCCDPRLLKLDAAKKVKERAKLEQLMDMLPELVDEGRKVLVFSQFTGMLALIGAELDRVKIPYFALLTGDTQDREAAIRGFQEGPLPVFLISLKAGGVGLNLTAADTVIHYDPWWNPAVENQATDRAHRIGQTKNVFVYKLVVAGSIEEKILALQEKKAELAAGVLSEDAGALGKFGEADIRALLAPLPPAK